MGWLFKRKKSEFWYAGWYVDGKERIVSTHCTNRNEAKAALARLEGGISALDIILNDLNRALDQLPEKEQDRKIESITESLRSRRNIKLAINDGWRVWEKSPNKKRTPKSKTLASYQSIWNRFTKWAQKNSIVFFHDVTRNKARDYAQNLWESTVTPRTYNAHIKQLQAMFSMVEEQAGIRENVWRFITRKEEMPEGRRNLTEEELRTIFAKAEENWKVMLAVGMFTGLRLGDVACLKWSSMTAKPGFIVVIPMKTSRKRKVVEIAIHPNLSKILESHRMNTLAPSNEFVFPEQQLIYEKGADGLTSRFKELFESCGITTTKPATGNRRRAVVVVGFHSLRHSYVSLSAKSGASASVIQKTVGHSSPAMTDIYTHIDEEQKQLATSMFPNILSPLIDVPVPQMSVSGQGGAQKTDKIEGYDAENRNDIAHHPSTRRNGDTEPNQAPDGSPSQPGDRKRSILQPGHRGQET